MTTFFETSGIKESSPFPDGQPHICLSTFGRTDPLVCRICTPLDLFNVAMAVDVLRSHQQRVRLRILYLMGARMDRRLSSREPYTLRAVCRIINSLKCESVSVLCPHSSAICDLLDNYDEHEDRDMNDFYAESILMAARSFSDLAHETTKHGGNADMSFVFPDAGATKRFAKLPAIQQLGGVNIVTLNKHRDERTGVVGGTEILNGTPRKRCIIIDDLCDGGATFIAAAKTLRDAGAEKVALIVCHGIFSKGLPIPGIDFVATTNSFCERASADGLFVKNFSRLETA